MTRPPVAALRRLYAVGGAPAASHVALCRAPGTERLLAPLARARVAHETSLDALARPIDVGGVLSRFAEAASNARRGVAESVDGDTIVRRTPRARPLVPLASAPARESGNEGATVSPLAVQHARAGVGRSDAPVRGRATAHFDAAVTSVDEDYLKKAAGEISPTIRRRAHQAVDVARVLPRPKTGAVPTPMSGSRRSPVSADAVAGATARVIIAAAVSGVERLLAMATPSAPVVSGESTRLTPRATRGAEPSVASDASRLLARAVERVQATAAATDTASGDRRRTAILPQRAASASRELVRAAEVGVAGNTVSAAMGGEPASESVGGFRGLAQRTLVSNGGGRTTPIQRIEPETRTSIDLATDTLDARVADSLARVLEREARRHGIDLAEARA